MERSLPSMKERSEGEREREEHPTTGSEWRKRGKREKEENEMKRGERA